MPVLLRTIIMLSLAVVLGGCNTPGIDDQTSTEFGAANLYPVSNSGFEQAFIAADAGLSSYRSVDIAPLNLVGLKMPAKVIPGTLRRDLAMTPKREAALGEDWAGAMARAFEAYDREGKYKPTLRIEARLIRIESGLRTATTIGGQAQPMADALDISAEFRLSDACSGRLLAVIRDTRSITAGLLSRSAPVTITQLFGSWAGLLHTRVSGK